MAVALPRQRSDFRCLHFVMERGPISVMFHFEYSVDLEVVTVAQGRRFLSINNEAAATDGASQQERHLFVAAA
jgi:hypothetical protein